MANFGVTVSADRVVVVCAPIALDFLRPPGAYRAYGTETER